MQTKTVIFFVGKPASGKSYAARLMADMINGPSSGDDAPTTRRAVILDGLDNLAELKENLRPLLRAPSPASDVVLVPWNHKVPWEEARVDGVMIRTEVIRLRKRVGL